MSVVKTLEVDDQLQTELTAAGEKLVVVYYTASWCAPCKKMKPVIEALSKKYPNVVFLKLDVDACQETAIAQGVTAMPTFAFHKNTQKIDVLQGADPIGLEDKINQHNLPKIIDSSVVPGHSNLNSCITVSQCECMNESDDHPFSNVFTEGDTYLESDCDPQLIMAVTFQQPVKIHSLRIFAPEENGPKDVKIFINQPHTLGFDSGESNTPVQELSLTPEELDGTPIALQYVKFQHVTNIQLYVKTNQNGEEKTVVKQLEFIGTAIASTDMGDFKRVSGKKAVHWYSGEHCVWTTCRMLYTTAGTHNSCRLQMCAKGCNKGCHPKLQPGARGTFLKFWEIEYFELLKAQFRWVLSCETFPSEPNTVYWKKYKNQQKQKWKKTKKFGKERKNKKPKRNSIK